MAQEPPTTSSSDTFDAGDDDGDLIEHLDSDAAEIARLELPAQSEPQAQAEDDDDERIARIEFHCSSCDMHEMVHYYGTEPPFALGVKFREDSYVMRDPFQAPPPRWQSKPEFYVALGVNCSLCSKVVCKDSTCSFYYTKTYCLPCGSAELKSWPVEAQTRLRKQLAAKQSR
ncbi:hypothetical protein ACLKA6_016517 [Drosophila palustris]